MGSSSDGAHGSRDPHRYVAAFQLHLRTYNLYWHNIEFYFDKSTGNFGVLPEVSEWVNCLYTTCIKSDSFGLHRAQVHFDAISWS